MKTYLLIQKDPRAPDAQLMEAIATVPGVNRVVHVEGPFDVIAEVDGHDATTKEALPRIGDVAGVLRAIPLHVADERAPATQVRSSEDLAMEPSNA